MLNWETDSSRTSTQAWAKLWIYRWMEYRKEKNSNYLHFEKRTIPYLKNRISFTQRMLCAKFEIGPVVLENIFEFQYNFTMLLSSPFFWTNLNPLYIRMICATFAWNWHIVFLRKKFLNVVNVFSICHYHLPLDRFVALQLL